MKVNDKEYLSIEKLVEMTDNLIDEHKYSDKEETKRFNIGYNSAIREIQRILKSPDEDDSGIFVTPYDIFIRTLSADMKRREK